MSRIRNLRLKHGWTQEELGRMLNVQKAAISKYEKGITMPSNEVLKKMSSVFNVSTDYLLDNEAVYGTPVYHLADEETRLLDGYRALDDSKRQTLVSMLAFLNSQPSTGTRTVSGNNINIIGNNVRGNNYFSNNNNSFNTTAV